jgi:hypothetical protein
MSALSPVRAVVGAFRAFLYVGALEFASYPMQIVDRLLSLVTVVVLLGFAGTLVNVEATSHALGPSYFVFSVTGFAMLQVFTSTMTLFRTRVRHFQLHGVLEAGAMTRTPVWAFLCGAPAFDLTWSLAQGTVLVAGVHLVTATPVEFVRAFAAFGIACLAGTVFAALGLVAAAGVLVFKQGEPLTRAMTIATILFGGTFVPRSVLPPWLDVPGAWLPIAPALDAMRACLYGAPWADVAGPLGRLAIVGGVVAILGLFAMRRAIGAVLRDGSLGHY